ncbi:MAG TPA: hypothetical protein VD704_04780 [Gaiellaceae bacterium]|nr:hypothetical protein [Gaiellaceae bacterium]
MREDRQTVRLRPLTERVLASLPGRREPWIAVWALVPWANAGANLLLDTGERSAVWEQRTALVVVNYAALSLAVVVAVVGADLIARRVEALGATTAKVLEGVPAASFRELNSSWGPLLAAAATALAFGGSLIGEGWVPALLRAATWFVLGTAIWTFLWTYGSLQLGLNRLGRAHLRRDAALVDPGLGLRPLGAVAFLGLCLLLAWLVPVLVTGLPDVVGFAIGLAVLAGGLGAFFFSLVGLHRQMVAVKDSELQLARELYAEAYEPVRAERTLAALERQHTLLGAADALEKRARGIHDWPVAEGTWAWVIGIATSVVAIACARLILRPFGF